MPLIFRAMQADGKCPLVGHFRGDTLGVREKVIKNGRAEGDIDPIDGLVRPQTGGMSVSPSKHKLPPHVIPKEHRDKYPDARRNKSNTFPWRMGEGEFRAEQLCNRLQVGLDANDPFHGFVEPDREMRLDEYRAAIEATRPDWIQEQW
jgi:hypothetical protein